ncbi:MAG: PDGLE domain-containing protein [Acidimicrobiia bacterium]
MTRRTLWFTVVGLVVAATLAFAVSRWASPEPDGLAKVAADESLDSGEQPHPLDGGPFAGYSTRGVADGGLGTGVAGLVGVAATFVVAGGLVWLVARRKGSESASS